jgi:hypothetical protein
MNQLCDHNTSLKIIFESIDLVNDTNTSQSNINLDAIDNILRECLTINEMRDASSFFTGQQLSSIAVRKFRTAITKDSVVLDPTCGAGNLLIECSRQLGIASSLSKTLEIWGEVLSGYDIYDSFIEATKLRLVLEAISRGALKDCSLNKALAYFGRIKVFDAMLVDKGNLTDVTHVIMNPPFANWESPQTNFWKKGKVNAAGIVFEHYLRVLPSECVISSILPDVLRSGSRYEEWRNYVSANLIGVSEIYGRFNAKTDVDVFLLNGTANSSNEDIAWFSQLENKSSVSDFFDVCIGPLVAYRDPLEGTSYPYIHSKNAPLWRTISNFGEHRRFKGRVIAPPFVIIRRTSSPTDKYRAAASIVVGKVLVAVENHLIVLKPKNESLKDCKRLIKVLKSSITNDYVNNRIRCRHLTVGAVKDIPFK